MKRARKNVTKHEHLETNRKEISGMSFSFSAQKTRFLSAVEILSLFIYMFLSQQVACFSVSLGDNLQLSPSAEGKKRECNVIPTQHSPST
jgi:hypothetical protein